MSLDVYLRTIKTCSHCGQPTGETEIVYDANTTHNLGAMAKEAGIYQHVWYPEELGITTASELIESLTKGILDMKARPNYYKQFNAANGWGTYEQFIPWLEKYLEACTDYPDAVIEVSR